MVQTLLVARENLEKPLNYAEQIENTGTFATEGDKMVLTPCRETIHLLLFQRK